MKKILIFSLLTILLSAFASAETIEVALQEKYLEGSLNFGGNTYPLDVQAPDKLIITDSQTTEIALQNLIQDRYSGEWNRQGKTYGFEVDISDKKITFNNYKTGSDWSAVLQPETLEIGNWLESGNSYRVSVKNNVVKIAGPVVYEIALSSNLGTWNFQGSSRTIVYNPTSKKMTFSTGTTQEISIYQSGNNYLGNLNMGGQTFGVDFNSNTNILRITYPDTTISESTVSSNQATWNYQGTSYNVVIDTANNKMTFSTGTTTEIALSTQNVYTGTLYMAGWSYDIIYYPDSQKLVSTKIFSNDFNALPETKEIALSNGVGNWLGTGVTYKVTWGDNRLRVYSPPEFTIPAEITLSPYLYAGTLNREGTSYELLVNTKTEKMILDSGSSYELSLERETSSKYTGTWNIQGQTYDIETDLDDLKVYFRSTTATPAPISVPEPTPPSPQPAPPAPTPVPTPQPTAQPECSGCLLGTRCLPYGTRTGGNYCDINGHLVSQLPSNSYCNNNYECSSNLCLNDQCVSRSIIQALFEWLARLFS